MNALATARRRRIRCDNLAAFLLGLGAGVGAAVVWSILTGGA